MKLNLTSLSLTPYRRKFGFLEFCIMSKNDENSKNHDLCSLVRISNVIPLQHVANSNSWYYGVTWLIIFLSAVSGLLAHISWHIDNYSRHPVQVDCTPLDGEQPKSGPFYGFQAM